MRYVLIGAALILTGCGPGLVFDNSPQMTSAEMLQRADHAFIGVIQKHQLESWPFFHVPGDSSRYWRVLRRRVRVENVLLGTEPRKEVDIYEIFWTGGASGDWNATQDNRRYLFLVRVENGRYHVVGDWWRSIWPITSGYHSGLPLNDSHPFWERVALLEWRVQPGWSLGMGSEIHKDPANALGLWREIKIERGLLRHPDPRLRLMACEFLLALGRLQDECFDDLPLRARNERGLAHNMMIPSETYARYRALAPKLASDEWPQLIGQSKLTRDQMDELRIWTAVSDQALRKRFCREFEARFPDDHDSGCPVDKPPPATIVTKDGDIPLIGPWPSQ